MTPTAIIILGVVARLMFLAVVLLLLLLQRRLLLLLHFRPLPLRLPSLFVVIVEGLVVEVEQPRPGGNERDFRGPIECKSSRDHPGSVIVTERGDKVEAVTRQADGPSG